MTCANPCEPSLPSLKGSPYTVFRPLRQFSIIRTFCPVSLIVSSATPGQRLSKGKRLRVFGIIPQERLSE